jgi:hypothetical protein
MDTRTTETLEARKAVESLTLWSTLLHGLQEENYALKTQLAEAIRVCVACEQLDALESFQARFIAKDTVIALLRRDLAGIVTATRGETYLTPEQSSAVVKLGRDMLRMKEQVRALKMEFEAYLASMSVLD